MTEPRWVVSSTSSRTYTEPEEPEQPEQPAPPPSGATGGDTDEPRWVVRSTSSRTFTEPEIPEQRDIQYDTPFEAAEAAHSTEVRQIIETRKAQAAEEKLLADPDYQAEQNYNKYISGQNTDYKNPIIITSDDGKKRLYELDELDPETMPFSQYTKGNYEIPIQGVSGIVLITAKEYKQLGELEGKEQFDFAQKLGIISKDEVFLTPEQISQNQVIVDKLADFTNADGNYDVNTLSKAYKSGVISLAEIESVFGMSTAENVKSVSSFSEAQNEDGTYNTQKLLSLYDSGKVTREDVEKIFGADAFSQIDKVVSQVQELADRNQQAAANYISYYASQNDIPISDINNLTIPEMEVLLSKGLDPKSLVAIGSNPEDVNSLIEVVSRNAEYNQQARETLNQAFPDGVPSLEGLAAWQWDNPADRDTIINAYGGEVARAVDDINKSLKDSIKEVDDLFAQQRDDNLIKNQSYAVDRTILEFDWNIQAPNAKLDVKIDSFGNPTNIWTDTQTGELLSENEVIARKWGVLTDSQKQEVVRALALDPDKNNLFANMTRTLDIVVEKSPMLAQMLLAPAYGTGVNRLISQYVTKDEAKKIFNEYYAIELATVDEFRKGDGTVDIGRLKSALEVPSYRDDILNKTGYSNAEDLIANLEYYNYQTSVFTTENVKGAIGDIAFWTLPILPPAYTFGFGLAMIPDTAKIVISPKTSGLEKGIAVGGEILMLAGGGYGAFRGKSIKGVSESARPVESVLESSQYKVVNDAIHDVSLAGRASKTVAGIKNIPNVYENSIVKLNNALENINRLADDVMSGRASNAVKEQYYNSIAEIKVYYGQLKYDLGKFTERSLDSLNNSLEKVNVLSEKIMSGELSNTIKNEYYNALAKTRIYFNNLRGSVAKQYESNVVKLNNALENINRLADDVMSGRASNAVKEQYYNSIAEIKVYYGQLKYDLGKSYEQKVQQLNDKLENINKLADYVMSGKVSDNIKNSYYDSIAKVRSDFTQLGINISDNYNNSIIRLNDLLENVNRLAYDVMSGKPSNAVKQAFINEANTLKRYLESVKSEGSSSIDKINDALERINKLAEKIMKTEGTDYYVDVGYLQKAINELKAEFGSEIKIAELELALREKLNNVRNKLTNSAIDERQAYIEVERIKTLPEWKEHESLSHALGTRQLQYRFHLPNDISKMNFRIENVIRKLFVNDMSNLALWDNVHNVQWLLSQGDVNALESSLEKLKLEANKVSEIEKSEIIKELDELKKDAQTFASKDDIDSLNQYNEFDRNVIDTAERLKNKNPAKKDLYDEHIEKLKKSIEKRKEKIQVLEKERQKIVWEIPLEKILSPETESKNLPAIFTETKEVAKTAIPKETGEKIFTSPIEKTRETPIRESEITPVIPMPDSDYQLGAISYPFNPSIYPDEAKEYSRLLRDLKLTKGYISEYEFTKEIEDRITELSREMTIEQAIKQALKEADQTETKTLAQTETFAKTDTDLQTEFQMENINEINIQPEIQTQTQTETQPKLRYKSEIEQRTKTKTKLPFGGRLSDDVTRQDRVVQNPPPGTVVFIQGRPMYKDGTHAPMYKVIVSPYNDGDMFTTRQLPRGYEDKGFEGEGSAFKSIQILGGIPSKSIRNLDLGFARVNVDFEGKNPVLSYVHDEDSNTGERSKTVGYGRGQIPVEVWQEAKARGVSYRDFVKGYTPEKEVEVPTVIEPEPMLQPNNRAWYQESPKKKQKPVLTGRYYRGYQLLPPDLGGSI